MWTIGKILINNESNLLLMLLVKNYLFHKSKINTALYIPNFNFFNYVRQNHYSLSAFPRGPHEDL